MPEASSPSSSINLRPRLLVLCQLFYPELISTGQTITELCEQFVDDGIDVEVVCGPPTVIDLHSSIPRNLIYHHIRVHRVPATRFPKLNLFGRIINQITFAFSVMVYLLVHRPQQPILVLTNPPFLALLCAFLRACRLIGPYHYLVFDIYPDTAVQLGMLGASSWLTRLWEWTNALAFRYCQSIIVIGRCMAQVVQTKLTRAGLAYKISDIKRIHIWTDERLIQSADSTANPYLDTWQLHHKFVVGYFGNMGRFHDIETILETARHLRQYDDILFLFVGEGHKKSMARNYAAQWGLTNCHFKSYVPRNHLGWSLAAAQVGLVSLQLGHEGLSVPSKALAMMAAGLPVLAIMSHHCEIAKIIQENQAGLVISPGEEQALTAAILKLYRDREFAKELGHKGQCAVRTRLTLKQAAQSISENIFNNSQAAISLERA